MGSDSPVKIGKNSDGLHYWIREDGARIAYRRVAGQSPTVVFLGGFSSDMTGTKAAHLAAWCSARQQAFLRLDYQGHGASSGRFVDGTIGIWSDDALAVIEGCTEGPLVLVGSSMGAWIMLLVAQRLPARIHALLGLASAPDFTEELVWERLGDKDRAELARNGIIHRPSEYAEEGCPISLALIEEAREHLLLATSIELTCPVRLLHGLEDADVPWEVSRRLLQALASSDVTLELIKGGDHRLSKPADLRRLSRTLGALLDDSTDT